MFTKLFHMLKEKFMSEPEKLSAYERYMKRRTELEAKLTPERAKPDPKEVRSPSGRYLLRVTNYGMGKGYWDYSRGEVFDGEKKIANVNRNYGHFPFAWAEGHPNGHSYLLCGEDYQAYTVIELDTGLRQDLIPDPVKKSVTYSTKEGDKTVEKTVEVDSFPNGYGFCWASIHPSPDCQVIAINGCYWAAPYEVALYDFRNPMKFPLPELERWDEAEEFDEWKTKGTIQLARTVEVRKSDKKPIDELEQEDWPPDDEWEDLKITKLWTPECLKEKTP